MSYHQSDEKFVACVVVEVFPDVPDFMMFMVAAFDFAIIWSLKLSDESRWPPRYLILLAH